jgi:hypothetical protein
LKGVTCRITEKYFQFLPSNTHMNTPMPNTHDAGRFVCKLMIYPANRKPKDFNGLAPPKQLTLEGLNVEI